LLQAYDEEVTIPRTLARTFQTTAISNANEKKTAGQPSFCALQRNAGLTASLLAAPPWASEKKPETPELANSLEKKPAKL
jgi:hypothetical protein